MSQAKASLFLVHRDTGQRYPVRGDVYIGRSEGDIVFARDSKLSQRHCRLVLKDDGVEVYDLKSANGTRVRGEKLRADKPGYLLPGEDLSLGEQSFTLQAVSVALVVRRRRELQARPSPVLGYIFAAVLLGISAFAFWIFLHGAKKLVTPSAALEIIVQRSLMTTLDEYAGLQSALDHQTAPPPEIASRIQNRTLLQLSGLTARIAEAQPENEHQQRQLVLERKFIEALVAHAKANQQFILTPENKFQDQMDEASEQLEQITAEYHQLLDPRLSPNAGLPAMIQSPLQMVEKEMRKVLRDYQALGEAVRQQKINDQQMAITIREQLLPKLDSVFTRMGALQPESPDAKARLQIERKLMSAFTGQLKAMALYAETQDEKYNRDVEHWTALTEKLNQDYKGLRKPASR